jgi:hypothetical protein
MAVRRPGNEVDLSSWDDQHMKSRDLFMISSVEARTRNMARGASPRQGQFPAKYNETDDFTVKLT